MTETSPRRVWHRWCAARRRADVAGSRVSRFPPDGSFDRAIDFPATQITSCVFASEKLDRVFVTSAAIGLSKEQRAAEPLAGSLFEVDPGRTGLPARQFRG